MKSKRERNKPDSMKRMKASYGYLLAKPGPRAPRKSAVARESGRSEELISRYFNSIEGLQEAYIKEQDYWARIFENAIMEDGCDLDEIERLFTIIHQENFKSFYTNKEMQNIITLQISEENPQMTKISAEREEQGELLFAKTDAFFQDSDISFRRFNSLLLGGVYYTVLHHRNNKSTVCSKDLELPEDMDEMLKTIGQMVSMVCSAARKGQKPEVPDFSNGDPFAALHAAALLVDPIEEGENMVLKHHVFRLGLNLQSHILRLENEVQLASFLSVCLNRLSMICNSLEESPFNASLVLRLIEGIIRDHRSVIPDEVEMPVLYCRNRGVELNLVWQRVKDCLLAVKTDLFLTDIISYPLIRFSRAECKIFWKDYRYLERYMRGLEEFTVHCAGSFVYDTLIGLGYNHVRFVSHYVGMLEESMAGQQPKVKEAMLLELENKLMRVGAASVYHFDTGQIPVTLALCNWIAIERAKDLLTLPAP